jgi:hypothetical protein
MVRRRPEKIYARFDLWSELDNSHEMMAAKAVRKNVDGGRGCGDDSDGSMSVKRGAGRGCIWGGEVG